MKEFADFLNEGKMTVHVDMRSSNSEKYNKELDKIVKLRKAKYDGQSDKGAFFVIDSRDFDNFKRDVENIKGANWYADETS